jgi:hypothetical protein
MAGKCGEKERGSGEKERGSGEKTTVVAKMLTLWRKCEKRWRKKKLKLNTRVDYISSVCVFVVGCMSSVTIVCIVTNILNIV